MCFDQNFVDFKKNINNKRAKQLEIVTVNIKLSSQAEEQKFAEKLRSDFKMTDRRFTWIKAKT